MMKQPAIRRERKGVGGRQRGNSVIEAAFMAPWIFFLFVGVFDFGFYAYALISVENAARVAALATASSYAAASNQPIACGYVIQEMRWLPNLRNLPPTYDCTDPLHLQVEVTAFTDSENKQASRVRVSYQTVPMIPIPGLLQGSMTIRRTAEMRVFGE